MLMRTANFLDISSSIQDNLGLASLTHPSGAVVLRMVEVFVL